ncbi:VWA domain-containing protein [Streptomyces sp. WMMC500]|uniref:VWA domain-containing protein n=1 Tax=Streptomyces sp. WMMC500 TaxID=3015154 RepID=UPI00248B5917|nr:VWA domain-containing protein [Streptomyces sp. WMMC500]WBB63392.1 VWA domain-containing protein [Streptomyces sp. WMMC500]
MNRRELSAFLAALVVLPAAACTNDGDDGEADGEGGGTSPGGTLRVLASSELADMAHVLKAAREATGIRVEMTYGGTLDAIEAVASGRADGKHDAVWVASADQLRLRPGAARKVLSQTPVMTSPVALGVGARAMDRLGWPDPERVTWAQVQQAVAAGRLTYGMTDPLRSNSGYSALIAVASALSHAQSALTDADVRRATPGLAEFFSGQSLTSGSSGWLADAYLHRGTVDALVNYESVLLSLNRDQHTDLTVIRPGDGVVTADYPLAALTSAAPGRRDAVRALTRYLLSEPAQRLITERTLRRPVSPSVDPAPALPAGKRRELPYPGSQSVSDALLATYEHKLRRPARTVYVLDTSGSMRGERLAALKEALKELTGTASSPTGRRFRDREEVTLMPFGSAVKSTRTHVVRPGGQDAALAAIRADVDALAAQGDTAIFSSLRAAYGHLARAAGDTPYLTTIVLMTDGENTAGDGAPEFRSFYTALPPDQRATPVFPIVFGDSDRGELAGIAELTGGRLFDASKGPLDAAFEEIRGYQ